MSSEVSPYDAVFYEYQREGALRSARLMLPRLREALAVASVLDVGCGAGAWLYAHGEAGVGDLLGLDGDYLDPALLLIDKDRFHACDITIPFDLERRFDLVECLEVAEHIPPTLGPVLIDNLVRHGDHVLFSAAVPGQGGKGHINERPLGYWRQLFAARGYRAFDYLRSAVISQQEVEWWYRYNTLLYVHERACAALPQDVLDSEIAVAAPIPDLSPLPLRLRKLVLRALPPAAVSQLAAAKHRQFVRALSKG